MDKETPRELLARQGRLLQADWAVADIVGRLSDHQVSIENRAAAESRQRSLDALRERRSSGKTVVRRQQHRRRQQDQARTASDERWDCLLECTPDLVVIVEADGRISHVNHAPTGLTHCPGRIVGRSIYDFLTPEHHPKVRESIERVLRTGQTIQQVVCFAAGGSGTAWSEACMGPITEKGRTVAVGMFFTDITERERLQARLKESEILLRSIVRAAPKMMDILEGLVRQGTRSADPDRRERQVELLREHMVQIGRLVSVGKASSSLAQRLPQFLTAIGMSIENALAGLEAMSCRNSVRQDLEAALREVCALAGGVEQIRVFAETGARRDLVHAVDLRRILITVGELLEARAQQANTTICLDGLGTLAQVRLAEGDAEQLFFSLIEKIIRFADGKKPRRITVNSIVNECNVELQFSGYCGGRETFNETLDRLVAAESATAPLDLSLQVACDIVVRAGGRIRSEHADGCLTFFVVLPTVGQVDFPGA